MYCTIHVACVINSPMTFTYYLDLSNFILESGLSYFRVLTICLLLVYFVSAAGCHCFDLFTPKRNGFIEPKMAGLFCVGGCRAAVV